MRNLSQGADPRQSSLFEQLPSSPASRRRKERKPNETHSEATAAARQIAFEKIQRGRSARYRLILEAFLMRPQTANEVKRQLIELGYLPVGAERNAVSPRICELVKAGCVEALDELRTVGTDAPATAWRLTERGKLLLLDLREKARRGKAN